MLEKSIHTKLKEHTERLVGLFHDGKTEVVINETSQLLQQYPDSLALYNILGISNARLEKFEEAIKAYRIAIEIDPNSAISYFNLGVSLQDTGKLEEALTNYKKAEKINPKYFGAIYNIASIFKKMNIFPSAINYYKKALALDTNYAPTYINLALVHGSIGELNAATDYFKKASKFEFELATTKLNLGALLCDQGKFDEGLAEIKAGVDSELDRISGHSTLFFTLNYSPDLSAEDIYSHYKRFDEIFSRKFSSNWTSEPPIKKKDKIKIGYVSADLCRHSVSRFIEPIFINHDKEKFEIYAFAKLNKHDYMTHSIKSYCDGWIDTNNITDKKLAQKIRDFEIDILVDLAGHTNGNGLEAFMHKPAPVSVSWWVGFGYTTGLSAIDYFLADSILVPDGSEHLFSEKVWKMDYPCSVVFRPDAKMGSVSPLPALTNGFITFGSLTRSIRLNYRVIRTWAEILKRIRSARLIINSVNFQHKEAIELYVKMFEENGIDRDRLDIGSNSPPWDILRKIDIALDCFPHNSGTTLLEHLYMGNPYITLAHRPSVGRIGSHYLNAIGRNEWIASTEEEYIEKVCTLSSDLKALSKVRSQLRSEMENSPLRDEKAFVKNLEATYQNMWEQYLENLPKN